MAGSASDSVLGHTGPIYILIGTDSVAGVRDDLVSYTCTHGPTRGYPLVGCLDVYKAGPETSPDTARCLDVHGWSPGSPARARAELLWREGLLSCCTAHRRAVCLGVQRPTGGWGCTQGGTPWYPQNLP